MQPVHTPAACYRATLVIRAGHRLDARVLAQSKQLRPKQ
jgi:hypothetical protein